MDFYTEQEDRDFRVRLISASTFHNAMSSRDMTVITFNTTPVVRENQRVDYNTITPVHAPGSIQVFRSSPSRTFTISAKLVSRTPEEALANQKRLQIIRSWTKPYFGESHNINQNYTVSQETSDSLPDTPSPTQTNMSESGSYDMLGAPPEILYFYGYATPDQRADTASIQRQTKQQGINYHKIPVVISDYDFEWPEDVDFIPTSDVNPTPFPVRMTVSLTLLETHSPVEYTMFNLADYQRGNLIQF